MKLSINNTASPLVWVCTALFFFCSKDYNPFTDPSNARAVVKYKSFRDIDTIGIFKTETLQVEVTARNLVDSFSVETSNNRLFGDSTVRASPSPVIPAVVFAFYLSFVDTGWQKVTVNTFRKNGDKASVDYLLFCTSPLRQDSIGGDYGDSILLKTQPVSDGDVVYHWDFGEGTVFEKTVPTVKAFITSYLSGTSGFLWVSDNSEKNNSPKTRFSFSFKDTTGPVIVCINNYVKNDTIQTGDSTFTFLARIISLQNINVVSASVNGQPFGFVDASQEVYEKTLLGLAGHTSSAGALVLYVKATDIFNNVSEKVFYVVYNAAAGPSSGIVLSVVSPVLDMNNTGTVASSPGLIAGNITNYSTQPLSVFMRLRVNGALSPVVDTLALTAAQSVAWTFLTALNIGPNPATVTAYKLTGDSCAGESFSVMYDSTMSKTDTLHPKILDISAGGTHNFYTTKDSLALRIIAVGEGRGILSLSVNGVSLASSPEAKGYIWYDTVKTFHSRTAGLMKITATDSGNRSSDTSIYIFKNHLPIIVTPPNPPHPLFVGTTYRDSIVAIDPDNDTVVVGKVSGPAAMTVSLNGYIQWTPLAIDTGQQMVTLSLFDGYQTITYSCTLSVAAPVIISEQPVRFVTTVQAFPAYLEVGKDSLLVTLQTVNGTAPLVFGAIIRATNTALSVQGNVVEWKPALTDTGSVGLIVTVSDAMKKADTLLPSILVVPPNRPFTVSMSQTAPVAADSSLDLSKATGPDTLRFTINDPDNPLVEQHTMEIIQSHAKTVSLLDSSQSFMVILDPARVSASVLRDTIEVIVMDKAGHSDSLAYHIIYHTVFATKKIVFNTTSGNGGAGVVNPVMKFPMLVRLDKTNFDFTVVNNAGSPLGFQKADGSALPFEIERWDSANGQAEIWVLVDTVFGNDSTHYLTMNWNPSGAAPQSNGAAVFDTANGFQAVWHFSEGTNSIAADATMNAYNGTPNSAPTDTTGVIGHAKVFDGQTSYFAMANTANGKLNFPRGGPFTISAWVNTNVLDANFYCIVSKGNNQYALQIADDNEWEIMDFDNLLGWQHVRSPAVARTWKYVVGIVNGANEFLYVDGLLANTIITSQQSTGRIISDSVTIGKLSESATRFFNGKIDEVRMSNVPRSADWIMLCYQNQKPGSSFITFK